MAEMTAAEAVAVLHNNQYQKHIGNGEYDYIHPLTDAQAKGIESIIEQQAAIIEKLKLCWNCKFIEADRCNKHNCLIDYPMREKCDNWQVKEGQNDV